MKNFGIGFIVSTILTLAGMVTCVLGYYHISAFLCLGAFLPNVSELKKYTTSYQFINFRVHILLLGFSVDMIIGDGNYWYTLLAFLLPFGGVLRLEFFKALMLSQYAWIEMIAVILNLGVYLYAGLQHPANWQGWTLMALPLLFSLFMSYNMISGARQTKSVQSNTGNAVGQKAPDFILPDHEGNQVSLSSFANKNHVLLVFVRGDWCPTCHIMIRSYEKNRDKFLEKEIVAICISPDNTDINRQAIERFGWKNILLSDSKQETTKQYGINFVANGPEADYPEGTPLPASFLVDKSGIVRYASHPDKVGEFLNPMMIFPVVESLA